MPESAHEYVTDCNCLKVGDWFHRLKCPVAKALRNCWCTPEWLCYLIGLVDIDPCSNERSRVTAAYRYTEEDDGLAVETHEYDRPFINPPYSAGQVIKWVRHWSGTRFIFLLRWDTSTAWFAELLPECTHVWFPSRRVDFEPPPHIRSSSNPYPHALYLRNPPEELLTRLKAAGYLFEVDAEFIRTHLSANGKSKGNRREVRGGSCEEGNRGNDRGGAKGAGGDREPAQPTGKEETGAPTEAGPTWRVGDPEASKRYWQEARKAQEAREWVRRGGDPNAAFE